MQRVYVHRRNIRKWETERKEHQGKVRLPNADIAAGNIERATERMNEQDGGLAKHSTECGEGINWAGRIKEHGEGERPNAAEGRKWMRTNKRGWGRRC